MVTGLVTVLLLAPLRQLFDLDFPRPIVAMSAVGIIALAFLSLEAGDRAVQFVVDPCDELARRHPQCGDLNVEGRMPLPTLDESAPCS